MYNLIIIIHIFFILFTRFAIICDEKITYIRTEHPHVEGFNRDYVAYLNLTSGRYGRRSPVYYVGMHFEILKPLDNNYRLDFYFYEFLTNQYKPSFVEMHFRWCNLIHKDIFFGAAMRQGKLARPCPHMPDDYHLYNMTILPEAIPNGFPFTKGRIYLNMTHVPTKDYVCSGHIDMEIKQIKIKNRQKNKKL